MTAQQIFYVVRAAREVVAKLFLVPTYEIRQFRQCVRLASKWHAMMPTSVVGLCFLVGPSAVAFLIVPIYVDAVERMTGRTRTHIAQKPCKRHLPRTIHGDSAGSIVNELFDPRVKASSLRMVPRGVFATMSDPSIRSAGVAVTQKPIAMQRGAKAVTTARQAALEVAVVEVSQPTAVALADPVPIPFALGDNHQTPKSLSDHNEQYISGSTHYYAKTLRDTPRWAKSGTLVGRVGNHLFFEHVA